MGVLVVVHSCIFDPSRSLLQMSNLHEIAPLLKLKQYPIVDFSFFQVIDKLGVDVFDYANSVVQIA